MERDYGIHPFRAAGSAGGRFPLELYVAVPSGGALPPGVHWYDPLEHALVQVGPAPADGPAPGDGPAIVARVPWRTGWRYRERGYRHIYWNAPPARPAPPPAPSRRAPSARPLPPPQRAPVHDRGQFRHVPVENAHDHGSATPALHVHAAVCI